MSEANILVVDDTRDNLHLLAKILSGQGYLVRPVSNGPGAISSAQYRPPDLILLDIMMPDMDGYEVCQRLKADERTRDVPIIFISALQDTVDKVKAFSCGGVDFITKPFEEDEVLARVKTHVALYRTQKSLEAEIEKHKLIEHTLRNYNQDLAILNRMRHLLQTCQTEEETYHIVIDTCSKLFPCSSGSLLMLNEFMTMLDAVAVWKDPPPELRKLRVEDFDEVYPDRALVVEHPEIGAIFSRIGYSVEKHALYVPVCSSDGLLAMLSFYFEQEYVEYTEKNWQQFIKTKQMLISEMVEHYALALVNLRLRESLRIESIRDPLTGLYNRRHMEAALEREACRAIRHQTSLGMMMFDIDHFKMFNDTHGHEAGDVVLRQMGALLRQVSRKEDIVCRYGGEEFLFILPGATLESTAKRAEELLRHVQALDVAYRDKQFQVTVSVGVAAFPRHGAEVRESVSATDAALYQAKERGRNQVVVHA